MRFYSGNTTGAIALTAMIVLGSVVAMIAFSVIALDISGHQNLLQMNESERLFINADGCAEEALLQLSRDENYAGGSYDIDSASCSVSVSGSGDVRYISADVNKDSYHHSLNLEVQLSPTFAILDFSY